MEEQVAAGLIYKNNAGAAMREQEPEGSRSLMADAAKAGGQDITCPERPPGLYLEN